MSAYLILDMEIHDFGLFRSYASEIPAFVEKHCGRYLVLSSEVETIEGSWSPQRVVVIEFPSKEYAQRFINDPEAEPIFSIRKKSTTTKIILSEGYIR